MSYDDWKSGSDNVCCICGVRYRDDGPAHDGPCSDECRRAEEDREDEDGRDDEDEDGVMDAEEALALYRAVQDQAPVLSGGGRIVGLAGARVVGRRTGACAVVTVSWPAAGGGIHSITARAPRMSDAVADLEAAIARASRGAP